MKILFTGASSFTGHWFVTKLAERGHEIWATFTRDRSDDYGSDVRGQRVGRILDKCRPAFSCRFGDERFLQLLKDEKFELLCHHAADVTNYRSPDFDVARAVANNTFRASDVLRVLKADGGSLLLTGTFFEPGEGAGSDGLPAISQYGLSKRKSADIFREHCLELGVRMAKFVIPNPFGPWEEPRFISYLARTWSAGDVATIRTPAYVRDNIHVSLLTNAYIDFVERVPAAGAFTRVNPSGYVETQGAFTERVAREVRARTGWECKLELGNQVEFDEPRVRTNTEPAVDCVSSWNESDAWDELAEWYTHSSG